MKIEFKNTTQAGNNLATSMFFDGVRVAEIHCTPKEFARFTFCLGRLNEEDEIIVSKA